jgi:hypothetical protein
MLVTSRVERLKTGCINQDFIKSSNAQVSWKYIKHHFRRQGGKRHMFIDRATSLSEDLLISKRLLNIKLYGVSNYLKGI